MQQRLVWICAAGLTQRLLGHAPRLRALAERGRARSVRGVFPAVTCTAQASLLTGVEPSRHGIVGNGWLHRDTGEVRFWLQSNALIQEETVYAAARRRGMETGRPFRSAKLFWWFNQGAPVDLSLTPKPHYGADGSKVFAVQGDPPEKVAALERVLGPFPFPAFWGPAAGLASTEWIARAAALWLRQERPDLTLVYLPHLDYDLQRYGPLARVVPRRVAELDAAAGCVLDAAGEVGAEVVVFSEYGLVPVKRFETPNRALRSAGLLAVRDGPFGETIDPFRSRALAVCDHQVAHVYVREAQDRARVGELLAALPGVERVLEGDTKRQVGLDHQRAGDLVLLAHLDAWFAYPYWMDERHAPDFARTVDIHRKPGYDPAELFLDPHLRAPRARVARRLLQRRLGFRALVDVVPLDPSLVQGSHGRAPPDPLDGPLVIFQNGSGSEGVEALTDLKAHALGRLVP